MPKAKETAEVPVNVEYDFDNYKEHAITLPRNKAWSNWFKFKNVGDKVQGYIRDVFYRKPEGQFPAARGITLEQKDGTFVNVSIKRLPFILQETNGFRLGDPLTVEFTEELPPKTKGYSPTKNFMFYGLKGNDPSKKTVAELDAEDMKAQGIVEGPSAADKEFDAIAKPEAPADVPFK